MRRYSYLISFCLHKTTRHCLNFGLCTQWDIAIRGVYCCALAIVQRQINKTDYQWYFSGVMFVSFSSRLAQLTLLSTTWQPRHARSLPGAAATARARVTIRSANGAKTKAFFGFGNQKERSAMPKGGEVILSWAPLPPPRLAQRRLRCTWKWCEHLRDQLM